MLIAVVSDTHRKKGSIDKALRKVEGADMLIHLGDNVEDAEYMKSQFKGDFYCVRGNCDFSVSVPSERIETVGGKKIFMTHGHKYSVKYNLMNLKYKALELGADIVLYGHTHMTSIDFYDGIWFINPGSAALSRSAFNSAIMINIQDERVETCILEV